MRELKDSDLFMKEINRGNSILSKVNRILTNDENGTVTVTNTVYGKTSTLKMNFTIEFIF